MLLRALSIGGRFLLIILITYFYLPENLGLFGLFNTSILLLVQFVGFDYYVYTSRVLIKKDANRAFVIYNQMGFQFLVYIIAISGMIYYFYRGYIGWQYFIPFLSILLLEHITTEQYRLLILFKKSFQASVLLFIKSAAWVFILSIIWVIDHSNFDLIFWLWLGGLLISFYYGYRKLRSFLPKTTYDISKNEIKDALKICSPFFLSTIFLKITEYSTRYIIDFSLGKTELGMFTFYANFASILSTIVFTLIVMHQYPVLLDSFVNGTKEDQDRLSRKFFMDVTKVSILGLPFVYLAVRIFVSFYNPEVYFEGLNVFIVLLLTNVLVSINYGTHYILFGYNKDRVIILSYMAGSFLTIAAGVFLIQRFGIIGAAYAGFLGFITILFAQIVGIWNIRRRM